MGDRRDSVSTYPFSISAVEPEAEDYGLSPDATDGMGSIEFTKEDDSGYYGICSVLPVQEAKAANRLTHWILGPSSNIAFTRNIRRALYALLSRPKPRPYGSDVKNQRLDMPHRPSLDVSRPATPHRMISRPIIGDVGDFDNSLDCLRLPPNEEMDGLVSHFFVDTGALFPFVHAPSFIETYNRVKGNDFRKFRRSWLGLLNSVLAMATVTSASSSVTAMERAAKAEVFYARAKALCLDQMLHCASLETGEHEIPSLLESHVPSPVFRFF